MRTPFMKYALAGALALSLAAGGAVVAQAALTTNPAEVTAGNYDLESSHGKITWSVNHFGLSTYTGQFVNVKAQLKLDPANPSASTLTATIPLTDVAPNDDRLKAHLQTADFFDTANHPTATFVSRSVTVDPSDRNEATVVGDLTLKGRDQAGHHRGQVQRRRHRHGRLQVRLRRRSDHQALGLRHQLRPAGRVRRGEAAHRRRVRHSEVRA